MCFLILCMNEAHARLGRLSKVVYATLEQLIWPCLPVIWVLSFFNNQNTQAGAPPGGTLPTTEPSCNSPSVASVASLREHWQLLPKLLVASRHLRRCGALTQRPLFLYRVRLSTVRVLFYVGFFMDYINVGVLALYLVGKKPLYSGL